jgi:hypothetical protein
MYFIKKVHFGASKFTYIFFGGSSRLDATILTGIISKVSVNFELKFFQVDIFLALL